MFIVKPLNTICVPYRRGQVTCVRTDVNKYNISQFLQCLGGSRIVDNFIVVNNKNTR